MTATVIPIAEDTTAQDIAGLPKPLKKPGDVTIESEPGNPDATVNLPGYVDTPEGVEEGDKLEEQFKTP